MTPPRDARGRFVKAVDPDATMPYPALDVLATLDRELAGAEKRAHRSQARPFLIAGMIVVAFVIAAVAVVVLLTT